MMNFSPGTGFSPTATSICAMFGILEPLQGVAECLELCRLRRPASHLSRSLITELASNCDEAAGLSSPTVP